ncbi:hypothetical protein PENTCL1PPCAC_4442, partial [Pristionchus entomophagus]
KTESVWSKETKESNHRICHHAHYSHSVAHKHPMSPFVELKKENAWSPSFYLPERFSGWKLNPVGGGGGTLGTVKKLDSPDGTRSIAVKKFSNPFESIERAKLILRELNLLRTIEHKNIVRLVDSYNVENGTETSLYHITVYCGTPLNEIIAHGKYWMELVKKWTTELLRAVQHLHSNGVIHRNLNPGNICIDDRNKLTLLGYFSPNIIETSIVKLGFGMARVIEENKNKNMTSERGKQQYSAIELIAEWNEQYDEKVDIWSVSVILCRLLLVSLSLLSITR